MKIASVDGAAQQDGKRSMAFRSTQRAAVVVGGPPEDSSRATSARMNYIKAARRKGGMLLLLTTTSAPLSAVAGNHLTDCPTYYDQNAAYDTSSNGLGVLMRGVAGVSDMARALEECPLLCAAEAGCEGYVFTPWDSHCWLLSSWVAGQFLAQSGAHSLQMVAACRATLIAKMPPLTVCVNDLSQNWVRSGSEIEAFSGVPPDECARLCAAAKSSAGGSNGNACVGFVTSPVNQCWLMSSWPGLEYNPDRDSVAMTQNCRNELANSGEPICPTYYDQNAVLDQNSNGLGGIMRGVADVSDMVRAMEECLPLCAADENCKGYVFTPWDSTCWLLASWSVGQFLVQDGVHSMQMEAACRDNFIAQTPCLLEEGTKLPGTTLREYTPRDLEQCKKECASDDSCEGIVHQTSSNHCALLETIAVINYPGTGVQDANYNSLRMRQACRATLWTTTTTTTTTTTNTITIYLPSELEGEQGPGTYDNNSWDIALKAGDGGPCTHTNTGSAENPAYWFVKFKGGERRHVWKIRLWNRGGCCQERLNSACVRFTTDGQMPSNQDPGSNCDMNLPAVVESTTGEGTGTEVPIDREITGMMLITTSTDYIMTICGIEIYKGPPRTPNIYEVNQNTTRTKLLVFFATDVFFNKEQHAQGATVLPLLNAVGDLQEKGAGGASFADESIPLSFPAGEVPIALDVMLDWRDQGKGNQQGGVRVELRRNAGTGGGSATTIAEKWFEFAPQIRKAEVFQLLHGTDALVTDAQDGDYYRLGARVGENPHRLYLHFVFLGVKYGAPPSTSSPRQLGEL